jgi:hypothetical protein
MALRIAVLLSLAALGCHHDKYGLKAKHPEEMVLPPDEPRFNNPPQSEYKKPDRKKEVRPGPGGGGSMGGPGMGGRSGM